VSFDTFELTTQNNPLFFGVSSSFFYDDSDDYASDLSAFTGSGTIQVGDLLQGKFSSVSINSGATLTYNYTPLPIPEPSTIGMLAPLSGLLFLITTRRRR
jgi:hypothetical protein